MTGLDVFNDRIIEIAVIITDGNLKPVDEGLAYTIRTDKVHLDAMDEWCQTTHGKSGLISACLDPQRSLSLEQAQEGILTYVSDRVAERRIAPLAGNSVHMDKFFMVRLFPHVINYLHYRIVDVSSIYELTRRWYPEELKAFDESRSKRGTHRALPDIQDSINRTFVSLYAVVRLEFLGTDSLGTI